MRQCSQTLRSAFGKFDLTVESRLRDFKSLASGFSFSLIFGNSSSFLDDLDAATGVIATELRAESDRLNEKSDEGVARDILSTTDNTENIRVHRNANA